MNRKNARKRALIIGLTGQDGSYLADDLLVGKGYEVFGMVRRTSNDPLIRFNKKLRSNVKILYGNLRDIVVIERVIKESNPDEIYNLAAQFDVGISFKCPEETEEVNYLLGDSTKATKNLVGNRRLHYNGLVEVMTKSDYDIQKLSKIK